jgi:glutathione peroxidase-family protein
MQNLTNDEKAKLYNMMLFQYQKIQEEIRRIKSENFEVSFEDQKKINILESQAKKIFNDTERLYR